MPDGRVGLSGPAPVAIAPLAPVRDDEYGSAAVLAARRRGRAERRLRLHSSWWYLPALLGVVLCSMWGMLRVDQWFAEQVIWPHAGARFLEVSTLEPVRSPGGRLVVVIGGLNRKSGTDIALALLPGLEGADTRVFSLVYGSGIAERDVLDKFDGLVAEVRPRVVDFYGSSMGGDIALILAAHAQQVRDRSEDDLATAVLRTAPSALAAIDPAGGGDPDPDRDPDARAGSGAAGEGTGGSAGEAATAPVGGIGTNSVGGADTGPAAGPGGQPDSVDPGSDPGAEPEAQEAAEAPTGPPPPAQATPGIAALSLPSVATNHPAWWAALSSRLPPVIGTIFLDCTPLGPEDVRNPGRTRADAITGLSEALHTDGGAAVRLAAEILAQQQQWSTGRFPFLDVRWDDLEYKFDQVVREKIGGPGISTALVKDQYGVIRRMNADEIFAALRPGTRVVYLRPDDPEADPVVMVDRVQQRLLEIADRTGIRVTVAPVPSGHHASADSQPDQYQGALARAAAGP